MAIQQHQHQHQHQGVLRADTKAWLRRKVQNNEPVVLEEVVPGTGGLTAWQVLGWARKQRVLSQLEGHPEQVGVIQHPAVPRQHWSEGVFTRSGKNPKGGRPAGRESVSSYGYRLLLTRGNSELSKYCREYIVHCQGLLEELRHSEAREDDAKKNKSLQGCLFAAGLSVREVGAVQSISFCGTYGYSQETLAEQVIEQRGLKASPKTVGKVIRNYFDLKTTVNDGLRASLLAVNIMNAPDGSSTSDIVSHSTQQVIEIIKQSSNGGDVKVVNGRQVAKVGFRSKPPMNAKNRRKIKAAWKAEVDAKNEQGQLPLM